MFLECEKCGYVQGVKYDDKGKDSDKIWGCASCKRMQVVNKNKRRADNGRGRRLQTCKECGHQQSVRDDGSCAKQRVWVCYACRQPQLTSQRGKGSNKK